MTRPYLGARTVPCDSKADELIGVDGEDEFTVLCASVGHVIPEEKNWLNRYPDARINPDFYKR